MIEEIYHENIMFYYIQQAKIEIVFGKPAYIEGHNGSYKWKARRASRKKIKYIIIKLHVRWIFVNIYWHIKRKVICSKKRKWLGSTQFMLLYVKKVTCTLYWKSIGNRFPFQRARGAFQKHFWALKYESSYIFGCE